MGSTEEYVAYARQCIELSKTCAAKDAPILLEMAGTWLRLANPELPPEAIREQLRPHERHKAADTDGPSG